MRKVLIGCLILGAAVVMMAQGRFRSVPPTSVVVHDTITLEFENGENDINNSVTARNVRIVGPAAPFSLHCIASGLAGQEICLINATAASTFDANQPFTIQNNPLCGGDSILTGTGANLENVQGACLTFDMQSGAWRVVSRN